MEYTTRPVEEIEALSYNKIISERDILVWTHSLDHLSEKQRKVFKAIELINMLKKEVPRKVYLQNNGRYAAYYRRSDGYRKLIIEVEEKRLTIVTFINTQEIPKIRL